MNPMVTLVIPTLNGADLIEETVASALSQDYPNLDIVISDNGSKDETPALLRSLTNGDRRVRLRRNDATVPIQVHFNQCVESARGEFMIMLDDDDTISPNFVSALVAVASRYHDVDVVVPRNVIVDDHGVVRQELATPAGDVSNGVEFVCHWLYYRTPAVFASVGTVLMRTSLVRRFGGYQALARGRNIDNLLFLQCAIGGRVGFAHDAVFRWRVYDASYAAAPSPRELASASRGFIRHLQRDPATVAAMAELPRAQRKEIVDGVRFMAAHELMRTTGFRHKRFGLDKLRSIFVFPFHSMYYRLVLAHYWRRIGMLARTTGVGVQVK